MHALRAVFSQQLTHLGQIGKKGGKVLLAHDVLIDHRNEEKVLENSQMAHVGQFRME